MYFSALILFVLFATSVVTQSYYDSVKSCSRTGESCEGDTQCCQGLMCSNRGVCNVVYMMDYDNMDEQRPTTPSKPPKPWYDGYNRKWVHGPYCVADNDPCFLDEHCCSNLCRGRCHPSTQCRKDGLYCKVNKDCCSKNCALTFTCHTREIRPPSHQPTKPPQVVPKPPHVTPKPKQGIRPSKNCKGVSGSWCFVNEQCCSGNCRWTFQCGCAEIGGYCAFDVDCCSKHCRDRQCQRNRGL